MNELKQTCLHSRHISLEAKMSPFGGFDMPIQYAGIEEEHNAVRKSCGVFDVSHMGEVRITGPMAEIFVNTIFSNDISEAPQGKIFYGMMLNENGGVVDDLLIYKYSDTEFFLVINASNIEKDVAWISQQASQFDVTVTNQSDIYAELAIQGPDAEKCLKEMLGIDMAHLGFYTFEELQCPNQPAVIISRTGYTGEDGFEIYATPAQIVDFWDKLIYAGVQPCGLGCRDTLRFEAGLPLYGNELTDEITPLEASLGMFVKLNKPHFIGREAIAAQKANGAQRKTVGLLVDGQAIPRHGYEVLDNDGNIAGYVTTGYHSITLGLNLAMAIIDSKLATLGTKLQIKVRRKLFPATVVKKRFYTPNYKH